MLDRNAQAVAAQLLTLPAQGRAYDLVYWRRDEVVEAIALAHHRRRPNYWRDRERA